MMRLLFFILGCFSFHSLQAAEHKSLILLTNPRTVSTAFEKSIKARGDLEMLHEPWNSSYLYHHGGRDIFSHMPPEEFTNANGYEEVKAVVMQHAQKGPIFVKDMVWCIGEDIASDSELLANPKVELAFLIRDPALSIESYFVKGIESMPLERVLQLCTSVIRYDGLFHIAERYHALRGKWPVIVESEEVCQDPKSAMRAFSEKMGIPFIEESLNWEQGLPDDWKQFEAWHRDAAESRSFFVPPRHAEKARFATVPEEYASILEAACQRQAPYYRMLKDLK